ncbi:MAG: squalene/phytoene synthase family protein [Acidobacteriota bacterium]|jgi:phytoene synthase|nr:squalene/phytoene synthase family protein [Acidobacteriota bacterium]
MKYNLAASYKFAADAVKRSGSNFSRAFAVLSKEQRLAFYSVYAFMRYCDDVSDGDESVESKREGLRRWRALLDEAAGNAPDTAEASEAYKNSKTYDDAGIALVLPAFRATLQRYSIPAQYFHWIIDGTEMDLRAARYETFEELYEYCFRVASAVGLVCLRIFGFREDAKQQAEKLAELCGIAFQLTNILRDIREDAERGRIYVPLEDLRRFKYTEEDLKNGVVNENFLALMRFEAARARFYYGEARKLLPLLNSASRPSLWVMMEVYSRLLDRIEGSGFDVFQRRVRLGRREKISIMLKAVFMRLGIA